MNTAASLTPFRTPGEALARHAAERGDAEAMVFPQSATRMTYGDWHERASALARALLEHGARPDADPPGLPLLTAADLGHAALVAVLLAHGADHTVVNKEGQTPHATATEYGKPDVSAILSSL